MEVYVFAQRLLVRGFDTSLDALVPQSCGVLMSNTGYLGPPDLDEFDKVVVATSVKLNTNVEGAELRSCS